MRKYYFHIFSFNKTVRIRSFYLLNTKMFITITYVFINVIFLVRPEIVNDQTNFLLLSKNEDCDDLHINCVRKCCPFGKDFVVNKTCTESSKDYKEFLSDLQNYTVDNLKKYKFLIDYNCPPNKVLFVLESFDNYQISKSNLVWSTSTFTKIFNFDEYCVDNLDEEFSAFYCGRNNVKHYYFGKLYRCFIIFKYRLKLFE